MFTSIAVALTVALMARAESHTVMFNNACGYGTPQLLVGGKIVSSGAPYTSNGPITSAIAYLSNLTGPGQPCGYNGENCILMELNMNNPACPGCGSSADISLIPDHAFSPPGGAGFEYYGGDGSCDGLGAFCDSPTCDTAFFQPDQTAVQRACQADNANILITFCGGHSTGFTNAQPGSLGSLSSGALPSVSPPKSVPSPSVPPVPAASAKIPVNVAPAPSSAASSIVSSASSVAPSATKSPAKCKPRNRRRDAAPEPALVPVVVPRVHRRYGKRRSEW